MTTVFVLLGFGFLLSSYQWSYLSGFALTLFTVSFNFLMGPLFHQLWFTAFLSWITGNASDVAPNASEFWLKSSESAITPSDITFRLSNLCSVSFLLGISGLIGRITL